MPAHGSALEEPARQRETQCGAYGWERSRWRSMGPCGGGSRRDAQGARSVLRRIAAMITYGLVEGRGRPPLLSYYLLHPGHRSGRNRRTGLASRPGHDDALLDRLCNTSVHLQRSTTLPNQALAALRAASIISVILMTASSSPLRPLHCKETGASRYVSGSSEGQSIPVRRMSSRLRRSTHRDRRCACPPPCGTQTALASGQPSGRQR